jgi:hypothetical protein
MQKYESITFFSTQPYRTMRIEDEPIALAYFGYAPKEKLFTRSQHS